MNLFKRKKKEPPVTIEPEIARPEPDKYFEMSGYRFHFPVSDSEDTIRWTVTVNVTKKNMKVPINDDGAGVYFKNGHIEEVDGIIKGMIKSKTIFELSNKSKGFADLEQFIGRPVEQFKVREYTGDYGIYYRVATTFLVVRD